MRLRDDELSGYVYVATAHQLLVDGISKIGITKNIRSRTGAHRKNSSAPFKLFPFQCFRFSSFDDARSVETWVKRELRKLKLDYDGGGEFFRISVSTMCDAVREAIFVLKLESIEEFPSDFEQIMNMGGDFISFPEELLECLEGNEARSYWQGIKDAMWILSRLQGLKVEAQDFMRIWSLIDENIQNNAPRAGQTVFGYFLNDSEREVRDLAQRAIEEMQYQDQHGFSHLPGEWEIPDWRSKISD